MLVIGGGPSGAATSYWLAEAGHDVVFVERKTFPREKTCGDGLTPRAVHQLQEMGLGERLDDFHRYDGLRACAHGIELELHWPQHPVYPSLRLRGAPVRPGHDGGRARGQVRVPCCARAPRRWRRCWSTGWWPGPWSRTRSPGAPRRSGPATWSSPTGPTRASAGRWARRGTAATPRAWPSGATSPATSATRRGSRARSTCGTATATHCPATAGSSRWATARSTWASGCCRPSGTSSRSTPPTS